MKTPDPIIERIRETRKTICAEYDNDIDRIAEAARGWHRKFKGEQDQRREMKQANALSTK